MNHYNNLATLAFRVVGLSFCAYGLLAAFKCLLFIRYTGTGAAIAGVINYGFFAVLGYLLFILSKRLAIVAANGLDNQ